MACGVQPASQMRLDAECFASCTDCIAEIAATGESRYLTYAACLAAILEPTPGGEVVCILAIATTIGHYAQMFDSCKECADCLKNALPGRSWDDAHPQRGKPRCMDVYSGLHSRLPPCWQVTWDPTDANPTPHLIPTNHPDPECVISCYEDFWIRKAQCNQAYHDAINDISPHLIPSLIDRDTWQDLEGSMAAKVRRAYLEYCACMGSAVRKYYQCRNWCEGKDIYKPYETDTPLPGEDYDRPKDDGDGGSSID